MTLPESLRRFPADTTRRAERPYSPRRSTLSTLSPHTSDVLWGLTRRLVKDNRQQELFTRFKRALSNNPTPSTEPDIQQVLSVIREKLNHSSNESAALRFDWLYNKLASHRTQSNKWAILSLLLSISSIPDRSSNLPSSSSDARVASPFISRGLQSIPPASRPYDTPQESPRNTRRRIASEVREPGMPPAFQLAQARLASRNLTVIHVSETALLRDLIYIFQGIDGQYVKFDPATNEYVMDSKVDTSSSTKDLVYRLTELGWQYRSVQSFIKANNDRPSTGLVSQAFCCALQHELTKYYQLIAILEAQIEKQAQQGSDELVLPTDKSLTLKRLLVWTQESLQKLKLMSVLVDVCRDRRGGALVSTMHDYTNHGDPFFRRYIGGMLQEVSKPFYEMLQRWIYEGELDDPYEEFFVACDPTVPEEELWQRKYTIREDMLPSFISKELAQKIFSIGKSLNFIRYSCHDDSLADNLTTGSSERTFTYGDIQAVERSIDATYLETSKRLLSLLLQKYKLMEHLGALKRYLLLGQGDFIQQLMDALGPGLSQPASTLFRHNLTGVLESAIRASNAEYDDPDILNRLDVRLLEISPKDIGWDVFTLDYHVDPPINTIFSAQAMNQYLRMFNFLWRLKRVEYTLSASWRRWSIGRRKFAKISEIQIDLHQAQLAIGRMVHFIYQLQHYYLFEVLECSWEKLTTFISTKSIDLDSIIEAHSQYLREILQKGFSSGAKNQGLSNRLVLLFDTILEYRNILNRLYTFSSTELSRRQSAGTSAIPANEMDQLKKMRKEHFDAADKFETQVREFLQALALCQDEDLRSLSTRLDYNDHYASLGDVESMVLV